MRAVLAIASAIVSGALFAGIVGSAIAIAAHLPQ